MSNLPELLAELLSETDARDLVDRVGLDARYIEFHGHPVNVWNNVLRAARLKPGKLQAIVDAASARYPDYTDELTKAHEAYLRSRPALEQADRYRSAMLEKVRTILDHGSSSEVPIPRDSHSVGLERTHGRRSATNGPASSAP